MTSRWIVVVALAVLAAYAGAAAVTGAGFHAAEAFPLGGTAGDGALLSAVSLLLGLLLGWGIPGIALALLSNASLTGSALLARALGLGVGYLFATSLVYGLVAGHAPPRVPLLALLALPNLVLLVVDVRRRQHQSPSASRQILPIVAALLTMMLLTTVLWQKARHEHFSGDGTEIYEWSRSLSDHPVPYWDLEDQERPGVFGVPSFASFAGAPLVHAQITLVGRGEISARLPFIIAVVLLAAIATGMSSHRSRAGWLLTITIAGVYILWHAYYVGNEPPATDLAESAGTDTLTVALWMAGIHELLRGSTRVGVTSVALSALTTMMGPPLAVLTMPVLWLVNADRARRTWRWAAMAGAVLVPAVAVVVWITGVGPDWWVGFNREFIRDLATAETRAPEWPLVVRLLISTAGLPLLAPFFWRRMSGTSRAFTLIGLGYLAIVLGGQQKTLHYLAPLPWVCLIPALELATTRVIVSAAATLTVVFALSWPSPRPVQRDAITLGRETCVQDLTYQEAVTVAEAVYDAFDQPATGERFSVGRHTFVRYAMDLDDGPCVFGLSPSTPANAVTLATNTFGHLWTTDIDRFVWWRFHEVPVPASPLFRRRAWPGLPTDAAEWPDHIMFDSTEGRALVIEQGDHSARLLVPIVDPDHATVEVGLRTTNTAPGVTETTQLTGPWRRGWNIVEVAGATPLEMIWLSVGPMRSGR